MSTLLYSSNPTGWIVTAAISLLLLGVAPAVVASNKGYSGVGFYFFGVVAFPFALMTALLLPYKGFYSNLEKSLEEITTLLSAEQRQATENKEGKKSTEENKRPVISNENDEEKKSSDQFIQEFKDICVCNHEGAEKSRYLIYVGKKLMAGRDLCPECAERLKKAGYTVNKA